MPNNDARHLSMPFVGDYQSFGILVANATTHFIYIKYVGRTIEREIETDISGVSAFRLTS